MQNQVYLKTMTKKVENNSIEDLDLLLKGLKDNKEIIGVLNKLQELQERILSLEMRISMLEGPKVKSTTSTNYPTYTTGYITSKVIKY